MRRVRPSPIAQTRVVGEPDYKTLRTRISTGHAHIEVRPLTPRHLPLIAWAGSQTHLENVAEQLERAPTEVDYLAVFADGHPVSKGGIDFSKEEGAGTIWQLATHPRLESLGLARTLIAELEARAAHRGITQLRLGVEPENRRGRRLYEYLGYQVIGQSEACWEAESADGSRYIYRTSIVEMLKLAEPE